MSAVDPDLLAPLFAPLTDLRGVGPTLAGLMARACGGGRVIDLLFHIPTQFIDRRERSALRALVPGKMATVAVEVVRIEPPGDARQPTKAIVTDGTAFSELVFFKGFPARNCRRAARCWSPARSMTASNMVHPDHIVALDQADRLPLVEPVWGLTAGLFPWHLRRPVAEALPAFRRCPNGTIRRCWPASNGRRLPKHSRRCMPPLPRHQKKCGGGWRTTSCWPVQVALALVRRSVRERPGRALTGDGALRRRALAAFGHRLTGPQEEVLHEIDADLAAPRRMLRLLQGDVGSGKTLVAVLAMLRAVEAGAQAALLAPTEVLAQQHLRTLERIVPVPAALLTGSVKGAARAKILAGLADGSIPLVVGTHALFQERVEYHDLALAVIDEQHRFGVEERLLMGRKGATADVLVMTATPIPPPCC